MASDVSFNNIPSNLLVPFFYAEINSGGSPYANQPRLLLVGPKLAGGAAPAGAVYGPIQSASEADAQFGVGSVLAWKYRVARKNAPFQPIWAQPLADPAGSAAAGSITLPAPGVTAAAILQILGRDVPFQINAGDSAATVAANAVLAINALNLPVTAAQDSTTPAKVNVTCRHLGAIGNGLELGIATDQPNVLTSSNTTVVAMSGGTGVPTLPMALANLGDAEYDFIASPYGDTQSLNAFRDFFADSSGRWSPMQQLYGHHQTAVFGNLSTLVTLGTVRNDPHGSIMGSQAAPNPPWEWAAALAAVESAHLANPPELSRPLKTLPLNGILPPRDRSLWFDKTDRQALYADGISGYTVDADGTVRIDRVVTTYRQTAAGVPDSTFRNINTMFQSMFASRYFRSAVSNKHSRQGLVDDNPFNLSELTTPSDIRDTVVHAAGDLVALGVIENLDIFAQYVVVKRDPLNADRVNGFLPIDVVNQLNIFAANITVYEQYTTASGAVAVPA
ncbi:MULTISPECIES: phage tail sheath subtilisin-like domain-containing protein [unclassified Bradyrhizobium]|uniref:phage tail sheath subtilisin-like domain-containing protein n=1 Tax=unclassified Bradyrhizobium TaxID=2631580 RepID=UPI0029164F7E|nr:MULTISPECIES: phage tail sheath subtilisin-like domain-containing protein [unclassified Bradyrhizobium]